MKKFKLKSMGPKQILAYIAFLIAVVWTLKFIFELTSSGVKQISKSSDLPILECIYDAKKQIWDLNKIKTSKDTWRFDINSEKYEWMTRYDQGNGLVKTLSVEVNRKTGESTAIMSAPHSKKPKLEESLNAITSGNEWSGTCYKIKNKKL